MPETAEEMMSIPHVTEANFHKYGDTLLEVTRKYAAQRNGLSNLILLSSLLHAVEFISAGINPGKSSLAS